jgi:predicted permease
MTLFARVRSWVRASMHRTDFERTMRDEMQAHLKLYVADLRRAGVLEAEAWRRARAEFGSVAARQDECREAVGLRVVDELRADVRYAARLFRRSPTFTGVALLSLALGIGANTAIFTLVETVLLKTLPVRDPQRLFFIDNSGGKSGGSSGPPYPCFEQLRDHNRFLESITAFKARPVKVTIDGHAEQVRGQHVSGSYFDALGVRAALGRVLTPADDSIIGRGGPDGPVAVISDGFWERRYGRDPAVLGKAIQFGTDWVTIVGVTPPDFFGLQIGSPVDITVPMMLASNNVRAKELWWMSVIGRLRPDATVEQARADLEALWDAYMNEIGMTRERRGYFSGVVLVPAARGSNGLRRGYSEPLLIVMGIVALVLLIGCANVANLLLARASARRNEIAVRLAIGASRARVIRQLLTEGLVLAALGALAGLVFAWYGVAFLIRLLSGPGGDLRLEPAFDLRVLGFAAGVAVVTALLFSVAPALHATRGDAAKPGPASAMSATRSRVRIGGTLVLIQMAFSVVLLCGAALFLRTLHNLNAIDPGFGRQGVLTFQVDATVPDRDRAAKTPEAHREAHAELGAMWQSLVDRLGALPGVTAAAASTMSPLYGWNRGVVVAVKDAPPISKRDRGIRVNTVTADYFAAAGISLRLGRPFTAKDRAGSPRVAMLNETAARTYFGTENPIGRRINFPGQHVEDEYEIVGVVRDVRYENLRTPDERMAYVPVEQSLDPMASILVSVRSAADVTGIVPQVRQVVAATVPGGFVSEIARIEQRVSASLVRERLLSTLATFFAMLALTLACIGLYGMMAYAVVRRTREIGIRIAIGARQRSVIWTVVRDTLALVAIGGAAGAAASILVSRLVSGQLFGVTPEDPAAIAAAVLLLFAVAAAAAYLPARRAARISPVLALRCE